MKDLEWKPIPNVVNVDDIQEILEKNKYLYKEISRLNNIINELEKYLDEALGQDMMRYDFYIILKKLEELKENNK